MASYPGSGQAANRSILEGTIGITRTPWKSAEYATLQVSSQACVQRNPWSVTAGSRDLRYVLP